MKTVAKHIAIGVAILTGTYFAIGAMLALLAASWMLFSGNSSQRIKLRGKFVTR